MLNASNECEMPELCLFTHLRAGRVLLRDQHGIAAELKDGTEVRFESELVGWISDCHSVEHVVGFPQAVYRIGEDGGEFHFENGIRIRADQLSGNHKLTIMRAP